MRIQYMIAGIVSASIFACSDSSGSGGMGGGGGEALTIGAEPISYTTDEQYEIDVEYSDEENLWIGGPSCDYEDGLVTEYNGQDFSLENGVLKFWDSNNCYGEQYTGSSSSINGSWTLDTLYDLDTSNYYRGCKEPPMGEDVSQRKMTISGSEMTVHRVYSNYCWADSVQAYYDNQYGMTATKIACNQVSVEANGKILTITLKSMNVNPLSTVTEYVAGGTICTQVYQQFVATESVCGSVLTNAKTYSDLDLNDWQEWANGKNISEFKNCVKDSDLKLFVD
jgi:hypothetical protein